ncbi:thiol:disulfide interchange protein [Massilia eurypsychrophila]|jgi:thiol-disulfide isomerase/thioredoxin|uniref:Thiol:disulfide interchange protein n=1 Tax=Massilia eurypsychrophila TaxID=1485217 RepID=A0A2G8TI03_9BURK|nr:TlpA disulfide reductase family protein [Massilia eurypsychrophila]PIL45672.1 thiol:disulfide interchange protein [Massilia eurypsychrophila]
MNTFNIGPVSILGAHLMLLLSLVPAAAVGMVAGRRANVKVVPVLADMLLAGFAAGRLVFVVIWFEQYSKAPLTMLDIRDGGFHVPAAVGAALAFGTWRAVRQRALLQPLIGSVLAGALAWFMSGGPAMTQVQSGKSVPDVTLAALDGRAVRLPELVRGKPAVVNLWASWCPPCIREMPVLAAAQRRDVGVHYVFANQGESADKVQAFLRARGLQMENVLTDRLSATSRAVGSAGMPTTLFFDGRGQLVDAHLGPLSEASLAEKLAKIRISATAAGEP